MYNSEISLLFYSSIEGTIYPQLTSPILLILYKCMSHIAITKDRTEHIHRSTQFPYTHLQSIPTLLF